MAAPTIESMQCFRHKKTTVAVTYCKKGAGDPPLLGRHHFAGVDMRIRIKGGGHTSQIYAICQSIAKALVAYYQKYVDKQAKKEIRVRLYSPRHRS